MALDNNLAFGGKCALACSLGGSNKAPAADARYTMTIDGVTYGFNNRAARAIFKAVPVLRRRAQRAAAASE
jgi:hypothetical protein